MNDRKIQQIVTEQELPRFRADQLRNGFFNLHRKDFESITTLSRDLRAKLTAQYTAMTVTTDRLLRSSDGLAFKALLSLEDGKRIETVLLCPKPGLWSCCISSQVGCALGCSFCATGKLGFTRNLTDEEISDQVLFWRQFMAEEIPEATLTNVVYMGMGEPFQNKKAVFASLDELMNPGTFGIGARHLSVSTSGLVPAMKEMADRYPQVNLALSLHAANDELRLEMMPINKKFTLELLAEAIAYYVKTTNRKLFIEYILIDGKNDSSRHADELAKYLRQFHTPHLLTVNLIPCNPTDQHLQASSRTTARAFKDYLISHGISATIRKTLGRDLDGACGQLALKVPADAT